MITLFSSQRGFKATAVTQSRLSDPTALYDLPGWAERFAIAALYLDIERTGQVNDDRAGRMLDALYDQRAIIWGDVVANAARHYGLDLHRLHADTMAMTFAGLFADQPRDTGVPRLEPVISSPATREALISSDPTTPFKVI